MVIAKQMNIIEKNLREKIVKETLMHEDNVGVSFENCTTIRVKLYRETGNSQKYDMGQTQLTLTINRELIAEIVGTPKRVDVLHRSDPPQRMRPGAQNGREVAELTYTLLCEVCKDMATWPRWE